METVELHEIDEEEFKSLLLEIPDFWKKNSGFFDRDLMLVFQNFGEHGDLLFGFHVFSHTNGTSIFVILTEYNRDARVARFDINAFHITGWSFPSSYKKGEAKFIEMLENLTYDELEKIAIKKLKKRDSDPIFKCPDCRAQYFMRWLQVTDNGQVECQNCKRLFNLSDLDVAQRTTSHDS